jgi:hypothetical protein
MSTVYKQICSDAVPPQKFKKQAEAYKGFYDYPQEKWDQIIKQRDREFLHRLKYLYWK